MKICMITPGWLPVHTDFGAGGIEMHVRQLVRGLVKRNHEVTIITTKHPEGIEKEKDDKLNIFYTGDSPLRCNKSFYQGSVKLFSSLNENEKFEIIHTQDYAGYGYYKEYGRKFPSVVTSHGTPLNMIRSIFKVKNPRSFPQVPRWIKYHFSVAPAIFHGSDMIISVSNELRNDIMEQYKVAENKIELGLHGIDTDLFKPGYSEIKKVLGSENEKIILYVGGIQKLKGVHILLSSLPEVLKKMDVKLVIVGAGPYLNNLKKSVKRLNVGAKVIFAGKIPNHVLPEYHKAADIVVVPSIILESAGLVILEAMSSGKPVIASRIGGIPTALEHLREGILIEPGNPGELSKSILELLNNTEMAENMGKAGRRKVIENFSLDSMVEHTIKIYEECKN